MIHGNNHAGGGDRVGISRCFKKGRVRVSQDHQKSKRCKSCPHRGLNWVEITIYPPDRSLAQLSTHLEGADVVTALLPGRADRFLILNSKGERAVLQWNPPKGNSFRSPEQGPDRLSPSGRSTRKKERPRRRWLRPGPMPGWPKPSRITIPTRWSESFAATRRWRATRPRFSSA